MERFNPSPGDADLRAAEDLKCVGEVLAGQDAITALNPVGAYAVQIVWSDGHDTGIYSFESLRSACACKECRP